MSKDNAILMVLSAPEGAAVARRWLLEQEPMVMGRHPACEIHLPDRQVSREHARIFHTRDGFFVEDLGSKNGTYVNGDPVHVPTRLMDGDTVQVGLAYRLSFIGAEGTIPLATNVQEEPVLRLDAERKQVWVNGKALEPELSPSQFDLLQLLADAQGGIVDRDQIATSVWGGMEGVTEQAIDALVRRLRRRLAEVDPSQEYIVTVRGYGFRLEV